MPFPFLWTGALLAAAFLSIVFTTFALALHLLDRTTTELRGSILPGLVSGLDDWSSRRSPLRRPASPTGSEAVGEIDEATTDQAPPVERLHPHLR